MDERDKGCPGPTQGGVIGGEQSIHMPLLERCNLNKRLLTTFGLVMTL